jgi:mRNA-degrading endonuclease RelE of RelBE toxin-antitoxin system
MYKIFLTEKAAKFLEKLSKSNLNKFTQKINLVAKNP